MKYLVQHVKTDVAEKLSIDNLYYGDDYNMATQIKENKTNEILENALELYTIEELEDYNYIEDMPDYWEYCDEDGRNEVVHIIELKDL